MWLTAFWRRSALPEALPVHWNLDLMPDATGTRDEAIFVLPIMATVLWALLRFLPAMIGGASELERAGPAYDRIRWVVLAFLAALFGLLQLHYAEVVTSLAPGFPLLLGLLLVALGLLMPTLPPNRFAGFRLPWTLRDPEVWARTHRVAGAGMVISGVIFGTVGLVSARWGLAGGVGSLLLVTLGATLYAARISRR